MNFGKLKEAGPAGNQVQSTEGEAGAARVVIVGAGFAGLAAAEVLKRGTARVTVIDRQNHHLFQPLLYQVATAGLSPADVAVPVREHFGAYPNIEVLMDEVVGVDRRAKRVITKSAELAYDHLILGTGAAYSYFGHDEWRRRTLSLKSLADALAIRHKMLAAFERAERAHSSEERERAMTFVIVGGGATGVELAGAVVELAKRTLARDFRRSNPEEAKVYLLEALPTVLNGFPKSLRRFAHDALERKGVTVRLDTPVEEVRGDGVVAGGDLIPADIVLWAAGVRTEDLGDWLGVETDKNGRVPVTGELSLEDDPSVFVVGDAASVSGKNSQPLPALAAVASQEGAYVGDVIRRRLENKPAPPPFRYRDRGTLATIGRNAAVADFGWLRLKGWPGWMVWGLVHIFFLSGFRNRLSVFLNWIWAYATYSKANRIIINDETRDTV